MPSIPSVALQKLETTTEGHLLAFTRGRMTALGLRVQYAEGGAPAFLMLEKGSTDQTVATVAATQGHAHGAPVIAGGDLVLDLGANWALNVSPDAWAMLQEAPKVESAGALLAVEGRDGLLLLARHHSSDTYVLDFSTWKVQPSPFKGFDSDPACFIAKRWTLEIAGPATTVRWSFPTPAHSTE